MPSGEVHHQYWKKDLPYIVGVSVVTFVVSLFLQKYYVSEFVVWYVVWYWAGRYFDPDLDLPGVTMSEGRMLRELGLLGVLLFAGTSFYAAFIGWIIKKFKIGGAIGGSHRTWLTHSIVPGTLIRVAFIDFPIYYSIDILNKLIFIILGGWLNFGLGDILAFILAQVAGLGTSDLRHILLDNANGDE
jgi:hypothetical protein